MLKKHAYLIIAHNEYEILKKLIKVLDDERNDIYIHIDKKSKSFKKLKTELVSCYSNIFFTKRINVTWGGDSQIKCELLLLEEAFKIGYEYYHLISGVDFPIKTQDYIHDYFDKYPYNYLCIDGEDIGNEFAQKRIKEYYFFQNLIGRKNINIYKILSNLQIKSIIFQKNSK